MGRREVWLGQRALRLPALTRSHTCAWDDGALRAASQRRDPGIGVAGGRPRPPLGAGSGAAERRAVGNFHAVALIATGAVSGLPAQPHVMGAGAA